MERPHHGGHWGWAVNLAGCPAFSLVDFSASINPLGPPPGVWDAIQQALPDLAHYPDPDYRTLREAIAAYHGVDPDWVLPGNGAAELLTLAGRGFAGLKTTQVVTPAFGDYGRSWRGAGSGLTAIPWTVTTPWPWETLAQRAGKHHGLILNNPHNPSGQLLNRSQIRPLLAQYGRVLVDEAFMDFLPPDRQQSLIADLPDYPQLIIIRSLTKFYRLPGLRLGYALAHPDILTRWQQWRDPWPVNSLAASAAIACVQATDFQQTVWHWLPPTRQRFWDGLNALPGLTPLPTMANFILVKTDRPAPDLQRELLQQFQLFIRDCLSFPELGANFFRVAVRTDTDNQRLITALAHLLT